MNGGLVLFAFARWKPMTNLT